MTDHSDSGSGSDGPSFGRRSQPVVSMDEAEPEQVDTCTTLDFVRAVTAGLIEDWHASVEPQRSHLLLRIRAVQDQLATMHRRAPRSPSPLAWVDSWSPR